MITLPRQCKKCRVFVGSSLTEEWHVGIRCPDRSCGCDGFLQKPGWIHCKCCECPSCKHVLAASNTPHSAPGAQVLNQFPPCTGSSPVATGAHLIQSTDPALFDPPHYYPVEIKGVSDIAVSVSAVSLAGEKSGAVSEPPKTSQVVVRGRQQAFRTGVVNEFQKCVLTGCDCIEALEAAHIVPFADGNSTTGQENPKNGLLMRADVHKIFDANLLKVQHKNGQLSWWVDANADYLGCFDGKNCDEVFSNKERFGFLQESGRVFYV